MEINAELMKWMVEFKKKFGDVVPLRQIKPSVTNKELIQAIKQSIEQDTNLLPELFNYNQNDKDILY